MTLCKSYHEDARFRDQPGLVTLFSGDAFNPSLESSVTKGMKMKETRLIGDGLIFMWD